MIDVLVRDGHMIRRPQDAFPMPSHARPPSSGLVYVRMLEPASLRSIDGRVQKHAGIMKSVNRVSIRRKNGSYVTTSTGILSPLRWSVVNDTHFIRHGRASHSLHHHRETFTNIYP